MTFRQATQRIVKLVINKKIDDLQTNELMVTQVAAGKVTDKTALVISDLKNHISGDYLLQNFYQIFQHND